MFLRSLIVLLGVSSVVAADCSDVATMTIFSSVTEYVAATTLITVSSTVSTSTDLVTITSAVTSTITTTVSSNVTPTSYVFVRGGPPSSASSFSSSSPSIITANRYRRLVPYCAADNCLRALRATSILASVQSFCSVYTAIPSNPLPLPSFILPPCNPARVTSACSCLAPATSTRSPSATSSGSVVSSASFASTTSAVPTSSSIPAVSSTSSPSLIIGSSGLSLPISSSARDGIASLSSSTAAASSSSTSSSSTPFDSSAPSISPSAAHLSLPTSTPNSSTPVDSSTTMLDLNATPASPPTSSSPSSSTSEIPCTTPTITSIITISVTTVAATSTNLVLIIDSTVDSAATLVTVFSTTTDMVYPPAYTTTGYPCYNIKKYNGPTYGDAHASIELQQTNSLYGLRTPEGASTQSCCELCFFGLQNCINAYWYSYQGCVVSQALNTADGTGQGISQTCPVGVFNGLMYGNDQAPAYGSTGNIAGPCGQTYNNWWQT